MSHANYVPQPTPTRAQLENWKAQTEKVFTCFFEQPRTMLEVEQKTGIMRSNICRYVSHLRGEGKIMHIKTDLDPITKRNAKYWSTNKDHWPRPDPIGVQLNLAIR